MATGEVYLVDLRKGHQSRVELCEPVEESDDEGSSNKARYVGSKSALQIVGTHPG